MSGEAIVIRELRGADSIEALTALLHRAYARLGAMGLNYTAVDQPPSVTAKRLALGACYVAVRGEAIVGTVLAAAPNPDDECAYFQRPDVASLRQFAVEPTLQGAGLGRRLVARVEARARELGCAEVALDTAEPAVHLVDFYARLGYRPVGHVQWSGKVYRSVVMAKALAAAGEPT